MKDRTTGEPPTWSTTPTLGGGFIGGGGTACDGELVDLDAHERVPCRSR
jgi:hypothetical protein